MHPYSYSTSSVAASVADKYTAFALYDNISLHLMVICMHNIASAFMTISRA